MLRLDSDVVGVQVHRPKKRAPWAALLLLANAIDCFSALHHKEGRRGKLVSENKKKKVFVHGFVAESAPLGGELSLPTERISVMIKGKNFHLGYYEDKMCVMSRHAPRIGSHQ